MFSRKGAKRAKKETNDLSYALGLNSLKFSVLAVGGVPRAD